MAVAGPPAILVDGPVAAGLEVLNVVVAGLVRMIEGIRESSDPSSGICGTPFKLSGNVIPAAS